jgi:membrane protein
VNPTFERIKKIQEILDEKAYLQQHAKLPFWRRAAHFWIHVIRSFQKNRGPVRAASLAYSTVLALIPVLALIVSISTGFLKNDESINFLLDQFVTKIAPQLDLIPAAEDDQEASTNRAMVVGKIQSYIDAVNSGTLGITAGLVLVFIAITVLSTVETTFNDMWGVTRGRSWSSRIVQYWAAITLGPLFLVTAVALTTSAQIVSASKENPAIRQALTNSAKFETNVIIAEAPATTAVSSTNVSDVKAVVKVEPKKPNRFARTIQYFLQAPVLGTVILKLLPFAVLSIFLTLVYRLMPATKVRWDAALVGGLVGGCLLQLNNLFNVIYVSRVVSYTKIYGGLGVVPIFLLGLYFSWLIVLLGAQVAYAFQNRQAYVQEKQTEGINQRGREFVALRLMAYISQKFFLGQKPPSRLEMANALAIPSQLACQVLCCMVNSKLLVEVSGDETGYTPGRPIEKITVEDVLSALRNGQGNELATAEDPSRAVLREEYERIVLAEMHAAGSVTFQNLVIRLASLPPVPEQEPHSVPAVAVA